jgi:hypothetical protein
MLIVMKCQNFGISKLCKSFQQGIGPVSGKDSTRSMSRNNFEIDRRIRYRFAVECVGYVRLFISSKSLYLCGIPAFII